MPNQRSCGVGSHVTDRHGQQTAGTPERLMVCRFVETVIRHIEGWKIHFLWRNSPQNLFAG